MVSDITFYDFCCFRCVNFYKATMTIKGRWRHVTPKGQGRDPNIFGAPYLRKIDAYISVTVQDRYIGPPIGMPSPMVTWPMTSHEPKMSNSLPQNLRSPVSPYPCKIGAWSSLTTNRKVLSTSPMVTLRCRHLTPKDHNSDPQNI